MIARIGKFEIFKNMLLGLTIEIDADGNERVIQIKPV